MTSLREEMYDRIGISDGEPAMEILDKRLSSVRQEIREEQWESEIFDLNLKGMRYEDVISIKDLNKIIERWLG